jgi:hypothetical protein
MPTTVGGPTYQLMDAMLTADSWAGRRLIGSGSRRGGTPLARVTGIGWPMPVWSSSPA